MNAQLNRLIVLLVAALLTTSCWHADAQSRAASDQYESLIREGDSALEMGDVDLAYARFQAASRVLFPETPNYEVLLRLALVKQRLKEGDACLRILEDFECALDVEIGEQPCFEPASPGLLGKRNPKLTAECFQRMCSEIFLGLYEDPTEATQSHVKGMRVQAAELRSGCQPRK